MMNKPKPKTECAVRVTEVLNLITITTHSADAHSFVMTECKKFGQLILCKNGVIRLYVMDGYDPKEIAAWLNEKFCNSQESNNEQTVCNAS